MRKRWIPFYVLGIFNNGQKPQKQGEAMKTHVQFSIFFAVIVTIFIGFACGPTKVPVRVMKPARVDLKGIHRVAVTEFTGPGQSGKLVVSILNSKLLNSNIRMPIREFGKIYPNVKIYP